MTTDIDTAGSLPADPSAAHLARNSTMPQPLPSDVANRSNARKLEVERVTHWEDLVHESSCWDELAGAAIEPNVFYSSFAVLAAMRHLTPYHIDHECNFLLQIVGTKTVRMLPPNDPTVIQEADLERFYAGGSRNLLRLDSQTEAKASSFALTPGLGLHFPVTAPHCVKNGPAVSISFSITFRTGRSDRREIIYRINHKMRTLGLDPRPVSRSQSSDNMKYALFNAARTIVKAVRPNRASSHPSGSRYSSGT